MNQELIGKWAFLIGLIVAILAAFAGDYVAASTIILVLFILGLIVGFMNIATKNITLFLVAVIALLILGVGSISALSILGVTISGYLNSILGNFIAFVGAAGLIVSIKAILTTSKK